MKERVSLAVTAAGLRELMKRLLRDAIPTPPIVLLYAEPPLDRVPMPNIEYGVNPEKDPPSSALATTPHAARAAQMIILYNLLSVIIFSYGSKSHKNQVVHYEYGIAGLFCKIVGISPCKHYHAVRF